MGGLKLLLTLKLTCEGSLTVCFFFTLDYAAGVRPGWWRGGIDQAGAPSRGGRAFKAPGSARQTQLAFNVPAVVGKRELGRIIGKTLAQT